VGLLYLGTLLQVKKKIIIEGWVQETNNNILSKSERMTNHIVLKHSFHPLSLN